MITFFIQDYRFGGPHNQIKRYIEVLPKKSTRGIKIIQPKKNKKDSGLINLKKISKFFYIFENILNIFYIILKKKDFFNKNQISCVVGINNLVPIISSKYLNKNTYWFIVENTNISNLIKFNIINFIFKPKIIFIDKFLIKKTNFLPKAIMSPFIKKEKKIKKIKKFSKTLNILCVGNINKLKAYDFLLNELIKYSINCNLSIIGQKLSTQKELYKNLENLKKNFENSSKGKIKFLGFKGEKFIKKSLIKSDLFILPSYSEGCPNVLLEAMSLGCIVLASNVGGISNIINHEKNGFLFDHKQNNFYKIYKKILNTKLSNLRKISKSAKKKIESNYSNKEKFFAIYRDTFFNFNLQ